ncbi:hypothetical protein JXA85_03495 [Candidatus Woesearchaeota archaeon]|nr:hypothetical protein [Candidatus Woesearchaeota archaeon]
MVEALEKRLNRRDKYLLTGLIVGSSIGAVLGLMPEKAKAQTSLTKYDVRISGRLISRPDSSGIPGTIDIKNNSGLIRSVEADGSGYYSLDLQTLVEKGNDAIPNDFHLSQNYPNPFTQNTNIDIATNEEATVQVYNVIGQKMVNVNEYTVHPGESTVNLKLGPEYASGPIFFVVKDKTGHVIGMKKGLKIGNTLSLYSPTSIAAEAKAHKKAPTELGPYELDLMAQSAGHFPNNLILKDVKGDTTLDIGLIQYPTGTSNVDDVTYHENEQIPLYVDAYGDSTATIEASLVDKKDPSNIITILQDGAAKLPYGKQVVVEANDIPSGDYLLNIAISQLGQSFNFLQEQGTITVDRLKDVTFHMTYPDSTPADSLDITIYKDGKQIQTSKTGPEGNATLRLDSGANYTLRASSQNTQLLETPFSVTGSGTIDQVVQEKIEFNGQESVSMGEGSNVVFPPSDFSSPTGKMIQYIQLPNGLFVQVNDSTYHASDSSAGAWNAVRTGVAPHGSQLVQNVPVNVEQMTNFSLPVVDFKDEIKRVGGMSELTLTDTTSRKEYKFTVQDSTDIVGAVPPGIYEARFTNVNSHPVAYYVFNDGQKAVTFPKHPEHPLNLVQDFKGNIYVVKNDFQKDIYNRIWGPAASLRISPTDTVYVNSGVNDDGSAQKFLGATLRPMTPELLQKIKDFYQIQMPEFDPDGVGKDYENVVFVVGNEPPIEQDPDTGLWMTKIGKDIWSRGYSTHSMASVRKGDDTNVRGGIIYVVNESPPENIFLEGGATFGPNGEVPSSEAGGKTVFVESATPQDPVRPTDFDRYGQKLRTNLGYQSKNQGGERFSLKE